MRFFTIFLIIFTTGCGLFGIINPAEPVTLSMMQEHELKRQKSWVLCRGYNHKEYSNHRMKRELERRNVLDRCKSRGFVEWTPELYDRSEEEEKYFK